MLTNIPHKAYPNHTLIHVCHQFMPPAWYQWQQFAKCWCWMNQQSKRIRNCTTPTLFWPPLLALNRDYKGTFVPLIGRLLVGLPWRQPTFPKRFWFIHFACQLIVNLASNKTSELKVEFHDLYIPIPFPRFFVIFIFHVMAADKQVKRFNWKLIARLQLICRIFNLI